MTNEIWFAGPSRSELDWRLTSRQSQTRYRSYREPGFISSRKEVRRYYVPEVPAEHNNDDRY